MAEGHKDVSGRAWGQGTQGHGRDLALPPQMWQGGRQGDTGRGWGKWDTAGRVWGHGVMEVQMATSPQGVSLELRPGEVLALMGPPGAGKSTLVSLLLRLHQPTAGRLLLDGHPLSAYRHSYLCHRVSCFPAPCPQTLSSSVAPVVPVGSPEDVFVPPPAIPPGVTGCPPAPLPLATWSPAMSPDVPAHPHCVPR